MRMRRPSGFAAFTTMWVGQVLSALGSRMVAFAISIWVWEQTGRATDLVLLVFFAFGGTVLFSPIAGALVDRWNRRLTLIISDAGSGIASAGLLLLFLIGSVEIWHLYAVNAVIGVCMAFQVPAYAATITLMMEKGRFPRANAMMFAVRSAPLIFAPGLAAALLEVTSIEVILVADAVSFLVAIAAVFAVRIPAVPSSDEATRLNVWQDSLYGFRLIWREPALAKFEALLFAVCLFASIGFVLLIPMILARGGSGIDLGFVQTIGAVGGVAGVVLMSALKPTPHKMLRILVAILVFSVFGRVLYGVGDTILLWAFALLFVHLCIPVIDGYAQSIWQEKVEPAAQGRVFGARMFVEDLTVPIAALVAGPLVDQVVEPWMHEGHGGAELFGGLVGTGPGAGMALVFVVIGVLGALVGVVGFFVPSIRRIETILPDFDADVEASAAPALEGAAWRRRLAESNDTATAYPRNSSVPELFEAWADRRPDAPALRYGDRDLTYRELDERANLLAHRLRNAGVGAETRVGLCLRSAGDWVLGALATLKAGGAYVPLDPAYPEERLAAMCRDAQVHAVLVAGDSAAAVPDGCGLRLAIDEIAGGPSTRPELSIDPDRLAYVMFTSGSTGRPKGVAVTHRNIVRLVCETNYIDVRPTDTVAQAANISFDAATFEAWGALLNGARLVGIDLGDVLVAERLRGRLRALDVDVLFLTTSLARRIAFDAPETFASLRHLTFGGEQADSQAVARLRANCPATEIHNAYGPTENTTYTTTHRCDDGGPPTDAIVPIGRPVANTTAHVLDRDLQPVPPGVVGELYTGGDGVARGYIGAPGATAERFLPDPYTSVPGSRMYRTGDLVRRRADGVIEFVGRVDDQVKVRGFRVEPGEIEHTLRRSSHVADVTVRVQRDQQGEGRLVAYVVPDGALDLDRLREIARRQLPEHMVPMSFVTLPRLPLNANGKVDAKALPVPDWRSGRNGHLEPPRTPTERTLAAIWSEVLEMPAVGVGDNFFELGGRSLKATRVRSRLSAALGVDVPLATVLEHPTLATLAAEADRLVAAGAPAAADPAPVAPAGPGGTGIAELLDRIEQDIEEAA